MGRITDLIPALYHSEENDLTRFTDILDIEVKELERGIKGITNLINVDRCPDDKLPYLAAIINCPLIGDDPIFWRKQIRAWPYILRLKGTQRSLELVLDSMDVEDSEIKTFFRDARGRYVTAKPEGEPFIDSNGLWRNVRTHYFGIDLTLTKDFVESRNYGWDESEISDKLQFWLERGKPYHAELLHLNIFPPDFLPEGHIHQWDDCRWGHPFIELHDWGLLPLPVFEHGPTAGIEFVHGFNVISDTQLWDMSTWGGTPYRELRYGEDFERGILATLERESTATWYIPYNWGKFTWAESERYSRDFELEFQRGMKAEVEVKPQPFGTVYIVSMLASLQPYWDFYTWAQHGTWGDDLGVPHVGPGFERDTKASVQWTEEEAPDLTWSKYRTWGDFTWGKDPTCAGTMQTGAWIDLEEEEEIA